MNTATRSSTQIAMVTGAAGGIGWATAQRLAADGYQLAILDLDGEAAAERAQDLGPEHFGTGCDVASESSVQAAIAKTMARFGRVDALVNNAGIGDQSTSTLDQTADGFDRVLNVHLRGTFLMSREIGRIMLDQRTGAIVNLSSIAGLAGIPGRNAYAAAKAGISAMTRSMACEWARRGVRVNAVAPGYVRTVLVEKLERDKALDTEAIAARTPMGRLARPEEIAQAIAFLISEQSSFITGTTLSVDGGWLALGAPESALEAGAN